MADLHSKLLDAPRGPNSFHFMQFLGNFGKNVCWRPPGDLAPPTSGKSWIRHCSASKEGNCKYTGIESWQ